MSDNGFNADLIKEAEAEDYSKVLNHLAAINLVGRGQLWPRGDFIQPHRPGYFKPESRLYIETLRKDRRNAKELEYVHSAGTWLEQGLCALELIKSTGSAAEQGRLFYIAEESLQACKEILAMRTSHVHAILQKGPAIARHLAEIVEAKHEAEHSQVASESYSEVYSELSAKYVVESAKTIAKSEVQPRGSDGAKESGKDGK